MNLVNGDCLVELQKFEDKSVDFFFLDLPYGQTACKWDKKIDLDKLWVQLKRLAKNERTPFFFSTTTKFGFELYKHAPKGWFRWDLVWKKNKKSGFLNAYKLPMRQHEMIYCFAKKTPDYDTSSHETGEVKISDSKNNIYLKQAQSRGQDPTYYDKNHTSKVLSHPLPGSDITQPTEDHELLYCFAKKTPDYDTSSHNEFVTTSIGSEDLVNPIHSVYGVKMRSMKIHKERLPTSDITQPTEDHELLYCFSKKSPDYDTSSHNEFELEFEVKRKPFYCVYGKEKKSIISKKHKERLPTSVITQPTEDHELLYCFAKKTPDYDTSSHETGEVKITDSKNDVYLKQFQSRGQDPTYYDKNHSSKVLSHPLPSSDISSWCEYKNDNKTGHRTAKPVNLMKFLLKYWTKEGDVVCDPTAGSGSMGIACKSMKRKFIGIEKDEQIFELMKKRIGETAV